jgi:outer membrane protein assembly factor BamB
MEYAHPERCSKFFTKIQEMKSGVKKMRNKVVLTAAFVMITTGGTLADWPQYLGPNRNSISLEKGILRSWPENGPKVLWTITVGRGFGGPVIKDGKVYLLDRDDKVGDNLRCFDLSNGKELWNFAYDAPRRVSFPGSRSVPIVDGPHVYSCGHNGDLYCIDINTHKRSGTRMSGRISAVNQVAYPDVYRGGPLHSEDFPYGQLHSVH